MKLKDRVAIVTGGGKGIGQEICLGLVKEGAKIVIAEIDIENSEKAKKKNYRGRQRSNNYKNRRFKSKEHQ